MSDLFTKRIFVDLRLDDASLRPKGAVVRRVSGGPALFVPETAVLCFSLLDSSGDAVALPGGGEFYLGIDARFGEAADLIAVDDSKFNVEGDWAEASLAEGRFSARVPTNTVAMLAHLGGKPSETLHCQLIFRGAEAETWKTLGFFPLTVHNRVADPSSANILPPPPVEVVDWKQYAEYLHTAEFGPYSEGDGVVFEEGAGGRVSIGVQAGTLGLLFYNPDQDKLQRVRLRGNAGMEFIEVANV